MKYGRKLCLCGKRYTLTQDLQRHLASGEHERMTAERKRGLLR